MGSPAERLPEAGPFTQQADAVVDLVKAATELAVKKEKLMTGKVAVVTGASQGLDGKPGIGRAIVKDFVDQGAFVYIVSRTEPKNLGEFGDSVEWYQGDVTQEETAEGLVKKITKDDGRKIDVLVNNAGITRDGLLFRMSTEDFKAVVDTNLVGAFLMTKVVTRQMAKDRQGIVVNISSVAGQIGNPGQANYSAAKAGLIGLTKSNARELASRNIAVIAVAPPLTETSMASEEGGLSQESREKAVGTTLMGRIAQPEEIARTVTNVVKFGHDYAMMFTGQVFSPNGGMAM